MSYRFPPDVARLVQDHLASGDYASEDEVLRDALQALGQFAHSSREVDEEYHQTVAAVREGAADAQAGRMKPLRDLIDEDRAKGSAGVELCPMSSVSQRGLFKIWKALAPAFDSRPRKLPIAGIATFCKRY
jgi:Arc/MetJ-type ribon-helix-helix transcriptional regulator